MRRPWYLGLLARALIGRRDREFVLGDMDELWVKRLADHGRLSADLRYVSDVMRSATVHPLGARRPAPAHPLDPRPAGRLFGWLDDLTLAVRGLRRRPRFALVVVLTIALGIGPTAAVFGLVEQMLLRPLPGVPHSRTAAYLELRSDEGARRRLSPAEFDAIRSRATLLEGVASFGILLPVISLEGQRVVQVAAATIYGDFFEVLGVRPSSGRLLRPSETGLDADPFVAVISEQLRDELFGAGGAAEGRTVELDGYPFTVIGVTGGGFTDMGEADAKAWVPLSAMIPLLGRVRERLQQAETTVHGYYLVRPRAGVSTRAAETQVRELFSQLREAAADADEESRQVNAHLVPGLWPPPSARESAQAMVRMMSWAVALILGIACANAANLLLFRNATLTRAVQTRRALGATPGRIARQQVAETLVLAAGGALVGVGVAKVIALPFEGQGLSYIPALEAFTLDWSMLAFLAGVSLVSALLFGVGPAILAGRAEPTRGSPGGRQGLLRGALSAAQLALTLALVVGGLLMVRTIHNLRAAATGVDVDRVVRVTVGGSLAPERFFRLGDDERFDLQHRLLDAMRNVPEVEAATLDHFGPYAGGLAGRIASSEAQTEPLAASMRLVTPGWFELFRMRTLHGRTFREADWQPAGGEGGVVITASLARRLFGRTDAVGRGVRAGQPGRLEEHRVLGVVDDLRSPRAPMTSVDAFFMTYDRFGNPDQWSVMVRVRAYSPDVERRLEDAAASVLPPELYIHQPLPLGGVDQIRVQEILIGQLLWILCGFAAVLSGIGLFAAVAFVVSQRNRELGIRVALGARRSDILGLVLRSTLFVVAAGAVAGLAGAYGLARIIQSRLFGVVPLDLPSYLGAATVLSVVTVLACFLPARAALRTDPVATLRQE